MVKVFFIKMARVIFCISLMFVSFSRPQLARGMEAVENAPSKGTASKNFKPTQTAASELTWGTPTLIQSASNYPQISVSPGGTIFMSGRTLANSDSFVSVRRSDDNGQTWGDPVQTADGTASWPHSLLAGEGDNVYIAWSAAPTVELVRSTDGGYTFGENVQIDDGTGASLNYELRPDLARDSSENIYAVWSYYGKGIFFAKSTDKGATFGSSIQVSDSTNYNDGYDTTLPSIAVAPNGTIYVVWVGDCYGAIYFTRSDNGGASFKPGQRLSDIRSSGHFTFNPGIAIEGNDRVYIVWEDNKSGAYDVFFTRSLNGGVSFQTYVKINDDTAYKEDMIGVLTPGIAAAPGGKVIISWSDMRNSQYYRGNGDIYSVLSTDAGLSFSTNTRVTPPPCKVKWGGTGVSIPAFNTNGTPHIIWTEATDIFDTKGYIVTPSHPVVVFIPGIMGSNLYDFNDEKRWLTNNNLLSSSFQYLQLQKDGFTEDCPSLIPFSQCVQHTKNTSDGMILRAPIKNDDVYEGLVNHFVQDQGYTEGTDFFVFNYDWRKDLRTAASDLNTYIDTILATSPSKPSKVAIVAHSMGGLVARQYISNSSWAAKVNNLITLGTPYLGAPKAFAVLEGLACSVDLVLGACMPDKITAEVLVHNYPAFHELLPSEAYFTVNGSGYYYKSDNETGSTTYCPGCSNYQSTYTTSIATNLNTEIFSSAKTFHSSIDNATGWNNVPVTILYGEGKYTVGLIREYSHFSWQKLQNDVIRKPEVTLGGDETVPVVSATLSGTGGNLTGTAKLYPFNQTHGGLTTDPLVLAKVDSILGIASGQSSVTKQSAADEPTGAEIIGYGVASIDVTDSSGNHTGPQSSGGLIEENIPGSLYFNQEDIASVSLSGGQNYTITVTPLGIGPVDISVRRMTLDGVQETLVYTGISASASSRIRMSGDPYQLDTWQFDLDGTGSQITAVSPTVETAGLPSDTTPPQAQISVSGQIKNSIYVGDVTVTITAIDNSGGSGVNRIEYISDADNSPTIYQGPFTVDARHATTLYAIATDKAGNRQTQPAVQYIGPKMMFMPLIYP